MTTQRRKRKSRLDDIQLSRFEREWTTLLALVERAFWDKPGAELLNPLVRRYVERGNVAVLDQALESCAHQQEQLLRDTVMEAMWPRRVHGRYLVDHPKGLWQYVFGIPLVILCPPDTEENLPEDIGGISDGLAELIQETGFFGDGGQVVVHPALYQEWTRAAPAQELMAMSGALLGRLSKTPQPSPEPIAGLSKRFWMGDVALATAVAIGAYTGPDKVDFPEQRYADLDKEGGLAEYRERIGALFQDAPVEGALLASHSPPIPMTGAEDNTWGLATGVVLSVLARDAKPKGVKRTFVQPVSESAASFDLGEGVRVIVQTSDGGLLGVQLDNDGFNLEDGADLRELFERIDEQVPHNMVDEETMETLFSRTVLLDMAHGDYFDDGTPDYSLPPEYESHTADRRGPLH